MTRSHTEKRFGGSPLSPVEHAKKRIKKHLRNHPDGVSTGQLYAWIETVRKGGVIRLHDFDVALKEMRDDATAVCTSGLWGLRRQPAASAPEKPVDSGDLPSDGLFTRFSRYR